MSKPPDAKCNFGARNLNGGKNKNKKNKNKKSKDDKNKNEEEDDGIFSGEEYEKDDIFANWYMWPFKGNYVEYLLEYARHSWRDEMVK